MNKLISSSQKILINRQYGSTHIVFEEYLDQQDNTTQPVLSF